MTSTLMSSTTRNVVWLDHPSIGCYTSYDKGEDSFHDSNIRLLYIFFFNFIKDNILGISVTRVSTIHVQPGDFDTPITANMPVFQPFEFRIIFLILWFLSEIDNLPMTRILLIFRSGIYPIMNVCL